MTEKDELFQIIDRILEGELCSVDAHAELLHWRDKSIKDEISSGLLCDGKELEVVKSRLKSYISADHHGVTQEIDRLESTIQSLKLKLSEAEKERDKYRDTLVSKHGGEPIALLEELDEAREENAELKAKLSGSCEGMTVDSIVELLKLWGVSITRSHEMNPQEYSAWRFSLAKAIHAQMTGRKL